MNKKFLPGSVLVIIAFVLSNLASLAQVKAQNTFYGFDAGHSITTGESDSGFGVEALYSNTSGSGNTACGYDALFNNTIGGNNTASGANALAYNTTGNYNTASGFQALLTNTTGDSNTASGTNALYHNTTGNANTANGTNALFNNTTGSTNMASGANALFSNTTGDNKIGTLSSSRRFKHDIHQMDRSSETLFALKPVTFRYKKDADPSQSLSFGLVAEDVAQVSPELITRDEEGKPQTVRYEAINAMLLNEFLKEHKTVQELKSIVIKQEAIAVQQQKQIEALTAGLQKVSAKFEASNAVAQTAFNDR